MHDDSFCFSADNIVIGDPKDHSIILRYDEESNMVKTFVDDVEATIGIDTPDWSHPIMLVSSKASWPNRTIVYDAIMEETGYLKIMTCSSSTDFDIYINASNSLLNQAIASDYTVHQSAYHKCAGTGADNSSLFVHKGDRVTYFHRWTAIQYTGVQGVSLCFIPINRGQEF